MTVKAKPRPRRTSSTSSRSGALSDFERFCAELRTEGGEPFVLHAFQKLCLRAYFAGVRQTVLIMPKKNGKSTLIAALVLYHLLTTPNANCYVIASTRDQAEIVIEQARMFIDQSPTLKRFVRVLRREIFSKLDTGRVRVLAAAIEGADGKIPTLLIVDEYHHAKSAALFGVLSDGLGPRNGQVVMISTAGAALDSPLGEIRAKAHEMEGFKRVGTHNHVLTRDFCFHEWCLDPEADAANMAVVKTTNPAPWHTIESLRVRHEEPEMTSWRWLRFACGIWTEGEEPGIDPQTWDALAVPGLELKKNVETYCALHFGRRGESAAIALAQLEGDEVSVKVAIESTPSFAFVEERVRQFAKDYQIESVIFDRRQFQRSAELLESEGFNILEHPQSHERMVLVSATVHKLLEEGKLHHDGDKQLRAQVLACQVKETERDWKYVSSTSPIDGLLALATAAHIALEMGPKDYVM